MSSTSIIESPYVEENFSALLIYIIALLTFLKVRNKWFP